MRIREYSLSEEKPVPELLEIWRQSVAATHSFLSADDIDTIAGHVPRLIAQMPCIAVLEDTAGSAVGFAGVAQNKLEMLFLHPDFRGSGHGRMLAEHLIKTREVNYVCVNEQNPAAVGFYEHLGIPRFQAG